MYAGFAMLCCVYVYVCYNNQLNVCCLQYLSVYVTKSLVCYAVTIVYLQKNEKIVKLCFISPWPWYQNASKFSVWTYACFAKNCLLFSVTNVVGILFSYVRCCYCIIECLMHIPFYSNRTFLILRPRSNNWSFLKVLANKCLYKRLHLFEHSFSLLRYYYYYIC